MKACGEICFRRQSGKAIVFVLESTGYGTAGLLARGVNAESADRERRLGLRLEQNTMACPVDHGKPASVAEAPDTSKPCPVDHKSSSTWTRFFASSLSSSSHATFNLSTDRETSSIPRPADGNWVYPSEAQFFAAMARKNHNPQAADMKTIVPIHNAVNERAWAEVMKWEAGRGGEACGGVKLVKFQGKPNEKSLRARWKTLLGFVP